MEINAPLCAAGLPTARPSGQFVHNIFCRIKLSFPRKIRLIPTAAMILSPVSSGSSVCPSVPVHCSPVGRWHEQQHLLQCISRALMSTQQWTWTMAWGSSSDSAKWLGRACVLFLVHTHTHTHTGDDAPILFHVPGNWGIRCRWLVQSCSRISSCCCAFSISFFTCSNLLAFCGLTGEGKTTSPWSTFISSLYTIGYAVRMYISISLWSFTPSESACHGESCDDQVPAHHPESAV